MTKGQEHVPQTMTRDHAHPLINAARIDGPVGPDRVLTGGQSRDIPGRSLRLPLAALGMTTLSRWRRNEGPVTFFAPVDTAFAGLPDGTLESLVAAGSSDRLIAFLLHHVVPGRMLLADIAKRGCVTTVGGDALHVGRDGDTLTIGGAMVVRADAETDSGVIHVIDKVLMPPGR